MSRREFLKTALAGTAVLAVSPGEVFGKQEDKEDKEVLEVAPHYEKHGHQRSIHGEWVRLEPLHRAVSNGFEDHLEKEIRDPLNRFSIRNFKGHIGHRNGKYTLEYSVDLVPVVNEHDADRVVSVRGKVYSGKDSKAGSHKLYGELVVPWQKRMKEEYPDTHFAFEVVENGDDSLYQKTCIAKGSGK